MLVNTEACFCYDSGDRVWQFLVGLLVGFRKQDTDDDVTTYVGGPFHIFAIFSVLANLNGSILSRYFLTSLGEPLQSMDGEITSKRTSLIAS